MAKRNPPDEGALYVKLPAAAVDKLDRAAEALGVRKKDLIAGLIARHVDPDSQRGLHALGALSQPRRVTVDLGDPGPTLGSYSFEAHDPPEVLTMEQVAELLQLEVGAVATLAEAGELPGRKLGPTWRFARAAVLAWLAAPAK